MMRLIILATSLSLVFANVGHALSCMRPDPASLYNWAHASEDIYFAFVGQVTYANRPKQIENQGSEFSARLDGKSLTQNGFTQTIAEPITIKTTCLGPWCGNIPENTPYLMVLRQETGGLVLEVPACASAIANPTPKQIEQFEACARGESCQVAR